MPLKFISEKPVFITEEEYSESTPSTFSQLPPILRLRLDNVRCHFQPSTAFPHSDEANEGSVNGSISEDVYKGSMFLTDNSISFLTLNRKGFSLDYPSLSLHAISRSLPQAIQNSSSDNSEPGCLYCQLDLHAGTEEEDDEGDENIAELWIIPAEADQGE